MRHPPHPAQSCSASQDHSTRPTGREAANSTPVRLADLAPGACGHVVAVQTTPSDLGERLMELGITPGTHVQLLRRGPWGDPLQIVVRAVMLSLRRDLAENILVAACDAAPSAANPAPPPPAPEAG